MIVDLSENEARALARTAALFSEVFADVPLPGVDGLRPLDSAALKLRPPW